MRLISRRKAVVYTCVCALQLMVAAPAHAAGLILLNSELLALFQTLSHQCLTFTYDLNGNRLTSGSQTYSTAPIWGSSVYGCFSWTP